ncbi:MAG: hypothetical protein ABIA37_02445 [Candidatus Woesearchaeota archaeon]
MVEKSLETYEKEGYCFMQWYRAYRLASYFNDNPKLNNNSDFKLKMYLKQYYWNLLSQAILQTAKEKEEAQRSYQNRVRNAYAKLRQQIFSKILKEISTNTNIILEALSIASEKQEKNFRIKLDTPATWLVRDPYE